MTSATDLHRCRAIAAALICLALSMPPAALAQVEAASDAAVKAALVYNFGKFVEWPAARAGGAEFIICTAGEVGVFLRETAKLHGKTLQGQEVSVRPAARAPRDTCRVLVLADVDGRRAVELAREQPSALSVSDATGFAAAGGMIGITMQDGKAGFEINLAAARRANLKINSQLLRLGRVIGES